MERSYNWFKLWKCRYLLIGLLLLWGSCKSIHDIEGLPVDTYRISAKQYYKLDTTSASLINSRQSLTVELEQADSLLLVTPTQEQLKPLQLKLKEIENLKVYRYTFDLDVLTVPFKVRPSVKGFPEQLNPNFDAALYFGRRRDSYTIQRTKEGRTQRTRISGVGYGYGGFVGAGAVTMNPFVTNQHIDYEYDGFVLNGGLAGIFDAKKFNLGIAIGADFLVDKNRNNWIYQGKPWFGVLFGINLN
jgi:hypothetical protein